MLGLEEGTQESPCRQRGPPHTTASFAGSIWMKEQLGSPCRKSAAHLLLQEATQSKQDKRREGRKAGRSLISAVCVCGESGGGGVVVGYVHPDIAHLAW